MIDDDDAAAAYVRAEELEHWASVRRDELEAELDEARAEIQRLEGKLKAMGFLDVQELRREIAGLKSLVGVREEELRLAQGRETRGVDLSMQLVTSYGENQALMGQVAALKAEMQEVFIRLVDATADVRQVDPKHAAELDAFMQGEHPAYDGEDTARAASVHDARVWNEAVEACAKQLRDDGNERAAADIGALKREEEP